MIKDEPEKKVASDGFADFKHDLGFSPFSEKTDDKKPPKTIPTAGYLFSPIEPDYPLHQEIIPDFGKASVSADAVKDNNITCDALDVRIIGELFNTYILAENGKSMWLIDKHAAHERQIYNQLKEKGTEGMAQYLFSPKMVVLSRTEKQVVLDNIELFRSIGFDTDDFGGLSVVVRSAPNYIEETDIPAVMSEIADKLADNKNAEPDIFDALLKSVACKSAIKAGMHTDVRELKKLVEAVLTSADLQSCPHGRPTAVEMTKQQIEKMFKRIV